MDKNQFKGEAKKATGKVKETAGSATGNEKMESEGKAEHAKGSVQKEFGDAKSEAKKATN